MCDIIPIDSEISKFSQYLNNNVRGILSARFGDGKSFFLNEIKERLSQSYIFITIYPINYQVAENKDIFEYIKRDILLQILTLSEINLSDEKYSLPFRLWGYMCRNTGSIMADMISLTLSMVQIPDRVIDIFRNNISKFKEYSDRVNTSESDTIETYLDEFTCQKGSIYEFDPISQIIFHLITDLKAKTGKQTVLVIEDMDRIDPAHIFRILNVFSAHWDIQDYVTQKLSDGNPLNKYNFDKILLVCHYQNIKNIFHHFYGEKTDFTGYIHKFSSSTPYEYSLHDMIKEWIFNHIPFDQTEFPIICRLLTTLIMQKYENNENIITNIRHITDVLSKDGYNIVRDDIPQRNAESDFNYYISTENQVTKLLCLLRGFQISIDEFLDCTRIETTDRDEFYPQLCRFIGQCWLIYPLIDKKNPTTYKFTFSTTCEHNEIFWVADNYLIRLTITEISSDLHIESYYKIDSLLMNQITHIPSFNKYFTPNTYKKILEFFQKYTC